MKRTLLTGHDETVAQFVAKLSPIEQPVWTDVAAAFGVLREDGALIAGVVFSNYRPQFGTLELSAASVCSFLSIEIANHLSEFVFRQLSTNRLWARTSVSNRRARATLKSLGFTEEGVQACHYGAGQHAVIARLLRSEWERHLATDRWPKAKANGRSAVQERRTSVPETSVALSH